jgi:dTDP-glucose pyrophosphorylase
MQTIITAAGDSRGLFVKGGFNYPKSLQVVNGQALLDRAIDSYSDSGSQTVVAINKEENDEFLISQTINRSKSNVKVIEVSSTARGALISALFCLSETDMTEPLVIAAGDSIVNGGIKKHVNALIAQDVAAGTIAFVSTNPRWSYLSVGKNGQVLEVAEKDAIGPLATTGVFYFRSGALFLEAAKWVVINNALVGGQFYVSTSLNYLISEGMKVGFQEIKREEYLSFSLPSDFVSQVE